MAYTTAENHIIRRYGGMRNWFDDVHSQARHYGVEGAVRMIISEGGICPYTKDRRSYLERNVKRYPRDATSTKVNSDYNRIMIRAGVSLYKKIKKAHPNW